MVFSGGLNFEQGCDRSLLFAEKLRNKLTNQYAIALSHLRVATGLDWQIGARCNPPQAVVCVVPTRFKLGDLTFDVTPARLWKIS